MIIPEETPGAGIPRDEPPTRRIEKVGAEDGLDVLYNQNQFLQRLELLKRAVRFCGFVYWNPLAHCP
jgi:hypothetical protein